MLTVLALSLAILILAVSLVLLVKAVQWFAQKPSGASDSDNAMRPVYLFHGRLLEARREAAGMSIEELSEDLKIDRVKLMRWEANLDFPDDFDLHEVARILTPKGEDVLAFCRFSGWTG